VAAAFGGSVSALQCMCSVDRVIHYTVVALCVYYYVKEPGNTLGRIGVSFLSKELERNTMVIEFTAVDDYVIEI